METLIISDMTLPNGGAHQHIENLIEYFINLKIKTTVLADQSIKGHRSYKNAALIYDYIHPKWNNNQIYIENLLVELINRDTIVVLVNGSIRSNFMSRYLLNRMKKDYIMFEQLIQTNYRQSYFDFSALGEVLSDNCTQVFVSQSNKMRYEKIVGGCSQKGKVVHNTISKKKISYNKKEELNNFLFVGRYDYQKGIDILFKAWSQYLKFHHLDTLTIISDFNPQQEDVIYIDWDNEFALNKIIHNYDCILFPSRYEGFSFFLLEALQTGIPIISSKVDGVQELINSGIYLSIFQQEAPMSMTEVMLTLKKDYANLLDKFMLNNEIINNQYTFDNWRTEIDGLFKPFLR